MATLTLMLNVEMSPALVMRFGLAALLVVAVSAGAVDGAEPPVVGGKAPDFTLDGLDGKAMTLSDLTKQSNVVLVVLRGYPGYQCPICTRQVGDFINQSKKFADAQARIVLVYPGPADRLKDHAEEFISGKTLPDNCTLVIDPDYTFTKAYGLRWDAPRETAYPSTFVIDRENAVQLAHVSRTHGDRTSAAEVLKVLAQKK